MKDLFEYLSVEFYKNDGCFNIVGTDSYGNEMRVDISVSPSEDSQNHLWEITCDQVFEDQINSDIAEELELLDEHPLLLEYLEPSIDIAFSENNVTPTELYGVIASSCIELMSEKRLSKYINQKPVIDGICSTKFGILGRFPESVANLIATKLKDKNININLLEKHSPKYWDGEKYVPYPKDLKVLLVGRSYIIGSGFEAVRA